MDLRERVEAELQVAAQAAGMMLQAGEQGLSLHGTEPTPRRLVLAALVVVAMAARDGAMQLREVLHLLQVVRRLTRP